MFMCSISYDHCKEMEKPAGYNSNDIFSNSYLCCHHVTTNALMMFSALEINAFLLR